MKLLNIEFDESKMTDKQRDETARKKLIEGLQNGELDFVLHGTVNNGQLEVSSVHVVEHIKKT